MKFIGRRFKEPLCRLKRGFLAGRLQHPGIDQVREDCIQIILIFVAGTNLPMLVEIVMSRKFMNDLDGLVDSVLETGKEQVTKYEFKQVVQETPDDGI